LSYYYKNPEKNVSGKTSCSAPKQKLLIAPNGDILVNALCFAGVLGNVKNEKLSDIWHGDNFRRFRELIKKNAYPACYRCCDLFM